MTNTVDLLTGFLYLSLRGLEALSRFHEIVFSYLHASHSRVTAVLPRGCIGKRDDTPLGTLINKNTITDCKDMIHGEKGDGGLY